MKIAGRRYIPFVAIVVMQGILVAIAPSSPRSVVHEASAPVYGNIAEQEAAATGGPGTGAGAPATGSATSPTATGNGSAGPSRGTGGPTNGGGRAPAPAAGACPNLDATGVGGLGANGLACGFDPGERGAWPWSHPWLLTGDRSLCAAGGKLQENVTSFSNPCTPKFTGDNGGKTSQGVTANEITVVKYIPYYNQGSQAILQSQNLYASPDQVAQTQAGYAKFFDAHFDLYGRRIKWITYTSNCNSGDTTCFRNEARDINTKYSPFAVVVDDVVPSNDPELFDELSRLHIVNLGGWNLIRKFSLDRRPYHWDYTMDGDTAVELLAEYWCKKLAGKPANLAGDAVMHTQQRKLGVVVTDMPGQVEKGAELADLVSGKVCGAAGDRPMVLSYSSDTTQMSQQATPMAVKLKQAGVTTVLAVDAGVLVFLTRAMDQQQYFPENMVAGTQGEDYDLVGRLMSPTQWRNAFGVGERPKEVPVDQRDDGRVWLSVTGAKGGPPCSVCPGMLEYERMLVYMIQWAGPHLTPATIERGAAEAPQFNGWSNGTAWPGWSCCDPTRIEWLLGPGHYAASSDVKEIYWDPGATSPIDGKPGTYVCIADCRRVGPGQWQPGEPVPARPRS